MGPGLPSDVIQLRNCDAVRLNLPPVLLVSYHLFCHFPSTKRPIKTSPEEQLGRRRIPSLLPRTLLIMIWIDKEYNSSFYGQTVSNASTISTEERVWFMWAKFSKFLTLGIRSATPWPYLEMHIQAPLQGNNLNNASTLKRQLNFSGRQRMINFCWQTLLYRFK